MFYCFEPAADIHLRPPVRRSNHSSNSFTFLATLFLLLFVSCAIILRSFILRRRFRQRVEAAILAGVLHPSHGIYLGSLHNFGEKPKMWDTWVAGTGGKGRNAWRDIMVRYFSTTAPIILMLGGLIAFVCGCTLACLCTASAQLEIFTGRGFKLKFKLTYP